MPTVIPRTKSAGPSPEVVLEGFQRSRFVRLRLERFPRGADNRHIDVALGPVLGSAVTNYVAVLVRENAQRLWKQPVSASSEAIVENFRAVLQDHQRAVVKGARATSRLERVQLFQLAVLKLLLNQIDSQLSTLRIELDDARAEPARQMTGQSLQFHQQAVLLGRNLGHIRFRVARQLMREYLRVEQGAMRSLRKAVLGTSWPVPEVMLSNPVLQLDGLGDACDFYPIYPLLLRDPGSGRVASRCVLEAFAAWLPENVELGAPDNMAPASAVGRRDQGTSNGFLETERRVQGLFGQQELNDCFATWLDQPDNAVALLGGTDRHWPQQGPWRHSAITRLQRGLNKQLASSLAKAGLMPAINASYELQAVYPLSGLVDSEELVFDFLRGALNRRELLRRLGGVEGVVDPAASLRRIEELRKDHKNGAGGGSNQLVARFAGDFLRLRRDLKLGWRAFASMDSLRLVMDESTLVSAQEKNRLQVFCREEAAVETGGDIVGHVIVKADIRGFAEVTVQMRQRNLDAAAHFSRYFYDPVTRLLEQFGARKVVVEGDALILSLLEYAGEGADGLAVARGCCIAAKLVQLMETMNAEHERVGLRRIELGLGVAYANEAPTYLYDHARKVTISPAIQRARELSSSHRQLRETCPLPGGQGLCVAARVTGEGQTGQADDELLRNNVNGIELDAEAFAQLNVEIALQRLRRRGTRPATFYAGRCPDAKGESHPLLLRERGVKLWIGGQLLDSEDEGRCYYEVVSDLRLIERAHEKLPQDAGPKADVPPPPPWH